jgi:hypothetical protein
MVGVAQGWGQNTKHRLGHRYLSKMVYVIDVGQAVEKTHPHALRFLYKDCANMVALFARRGVKMPSGVRNTRTVYISFCTVGCIMLCGKAKAQCAHLLFSCPAQP